MLTDLAAEQDDVWYDAPHSMCNLDIEFCLAVSDTPPRPVVTNGRLYSKMYLAVIHCLA